MKESLDKGIIVGDVVTAFHKGYHQVVKISRSYGKNGIATIFNVEENSDLSGLEELVVYFHYKQIVDENYNFVSTSTVKCGNHADVELVTVSTLDLIKESLFAKIEESVNSLKKIARK